MKRLIRCSSSDELSTSEIKERISRDILTKISDSGLQFAIRRILFSPDNNVDWKSAWKQIQDEMPEIR